MKLTKTTTLMLGAAVSTLALMQPAMAIDAQAFVDRIAAVYEKGGIKLVFGEATADGDTVTVNGVTFAPIAEAEGVEPLVIDTELTFTGVSDTEGGGFTAEAMTVPDVDAEFSTEPAGRVTLSDIVVEDIWLPPADAIDSLSLIQSAVRIATGPLSVTRNGEEVIAFEGIEAVSDFAYDDTDALSEVTSSFALTGLTADLSTVGEEEPEAGAVIEALGLTNISGSYVQSSTWTLADGRMLLDQMTLDLADVGAINIALDVSGFTPALLDKISAMQDTGVDPASEEGQAQQMMLGMELLQNVTLTSASVRYDDASLAPKLIEFFATQSGVDAAQFKEIVKAMVPEMVGQAGIPALTDLVVPAANAFLDDPQSFEIAVQPATPTTLLVLSAAAANPAGLISALGLTVTANQAAE